jgi:uncharacterized cupin superfamily protein
MKIVNLRDVQAQRWDSPKGKFAMIDQELSVALGRNPDSASARDRHPFDVEVMTVPAGKIACPYHMHSAQWEYYQVLSGAGFVRHAKGTTALVPGDAFLFGPGEAHTISGGEAEALVVLLVADNPIGESGYYPDSQKWIVRSPARRLLRGDPLDYLDGEE